MEQCGVLYNARKVDEELVFDINFALAQQFFPEHLEELVLSTLSEFEQYAYAAGLVAYYVQEDGTLVWKRTRRML